MRQYLKLFKENYLLTKHEIIYSLDKYIEHCREAPIEEGWSPVKRDNMIDLCSQFKRTIEETKIPRILDDWYFYDYNFDSDGIQLSLSYCEDIQFDEYGQVSQMDCSEAFELIKVQCEYLSVEEFARMFGVKAQTVRKWINKGRMRTAKLCGNDWRIPKIADKPKRKFESANYYWPQKIKSDNNEFDFLEKCSGIHISQEETNKEMYKVVLNDTNNQFIDTLTLTEIQREKLECFLIALPEVKCVTFNDCIKYVPTKKEIYDKIHENERLSRTAKNESDDPDDERLEYGAVIVTKGKHKGRIGYFDNESDFADKGVVYWGNMYLCRDHYELVPYQYLSNNISTLDLLRRIEELNKKIAMLSAGPGKGRQRKERL